MDIKEYHRIMIIGNNGSGKSYVSKELSKITRLPVIHLDVHFWKPNWEMTPRDEWIKIQEGLVAKEEWIIEGNHCSTMEIRFKRTEMIIFLDVNRFTCLWRLLRRNGKKRADMPDYLDEKFNLEFFQFCRRMWKFPQSGKKIILSLHEQYPEKEFVVIKSSKQLHKLLLLLNKGKSKYPIE